MPSPLLCRRRLSSKTNCSTAGHSNTWQTRTPRREVSRVLWGVGRGEQAWLLRGWFGRNQPVMVRSTRSQCVKVKTPVSPCLCLWMILLSQALLRCPSAILSAIKGKPEAVATWPALASVVSCYVWGYPHVCDVFILWTLYWNVVREG